MTSQPVHTASPALIVAAAAAASSSWVAAAGGSRAGDAGGAGPAPPAQHRPEPPSRPPPPAAAAPWRGGDGATARGPDGARSGRPGQGSPFEQARRCARPQGYESRSLGPAPARDPVRKGSRQDSPPTSPRPSIVCRGMALVRPSPKDHCISAISSAAELFK